jgi:ribosomal protein S2
MPRLIPLRAPKDLNFWRGSWKTLKRVQATERLIQDKKNLIASSKQEAEDLTTQLKTELVELRTFNRQIVLGEDKDDEAAITEADCVHVEAIGAIDEFL